MKSAKTTERKQKQRLLPSLPHDSLTDVLGGGATPPPAVTSNPGGSGGGPIIQD